MTDKVKRWLDADVLATLDALHRARASGHPPGTIFVPEPLLGRVSIAEIDSILHEVERLRRDVRRSTAPDLLALRMASNGRGRLYDHVRSGETFDLGDNYRVVRFFDFGAESLLFLGEARLSGQPLVVKLPFVDYTDLTDLDVEQLLRRRKRLGREAEMLRALGGTALPSFIAECSGLNPLFPAGLPSFLRLSEQFLLMELIRGRRVDDLGRWLHRTGRSCCCARLAAAFGAAFLALASDIEHRIGPAGTYTDIKPENALVQGTTVRIVDASSIVRDAHAAGPLPVSEAYLDPVDLERCEGGPSSLMSRICFDRSRDACGCSCRMARCSLGGLPPTGPLVPRSSLAPPWIRSSPNRRLRRLGRPTSCGACSINSRARTAAARSQRRRARSVEIHNQNPVYRAVVVEPQFYRDGNAYFDGIWAQAEEAPAGQHALLRDLSGYEDGLEATRLRTLSGLGEAHFDAALAALKGHDVLTTNNGHYRYSVELMRRWVATSERTGGSGRYASAAVGCAPRGSWCARGPGIEFTRPLGSTVGLSAYGQRIR